MIREGEMESRKPKDPENRLVRAGLLMDTYGALLTERQRRFMRLHYEQDLSFSEIAREFKISRQAVHDSVKHATAGLLRFEEVLKLVEKSDAATSQAVQAHIGGRQLIERLDQLRRRVQRENTIFDPMWIVRELSVLIGLLQGGRAAEPKSTPPEEPAKNV
jgi:hypothetical protein